MKTGQLLYLILLEIFSWNLLCAVRKPKSPQQNHVQLDSNQQPQPRYQLTAFTTTMKGVSEPRDEPSTDSSVTVSLPFSPLGPLTLKSRATLPQYVPSEFLTDRIQKDINMIIIVCYYFWYGSLRSNTDTKDLNPAYQKLH